MRALLQMVRVWVDLNLPMRSGGYTTTHRAGTHSVVCCCHRWQHTHACDVRVMRMLRAAYVGAQGRP
jgi:hypothetical protein